MKFLFGSLIIAVMLVLGFSIHYASADSSIPSWIKKNAGWWSDGTIGDDDFVKGIQYLIQSGTMKIPPSTSSISSSHQIPSWIKKNAGWWSDGTIGDDDFVKGIQYLVSNGIISVSSSTTTSGTSSTTTSGTSSTTTSGTSSSSSSNEVLLTDTKFTGPQSVSFGDFHTLSLKNISDLPMQVFVGDPTNNLEVLPGYPREINVLPGIYKICKFNGMSDTDQPCISITVTPATASTSTGAPNEVLLTPTKYTGPSTLKLSEFKKIILKNISSDKINVETYDKYDAEHLLTVIPGTPHEVTIPYTGTFTICKENVSSVDRTPPCISIEITP